MLVIGLAFHIHVYAANKEYTFSYTGNYQEFVAPYTGEYKLEVWGAGGGSYNNSSLGGAGGYSTGTLNLKKGQVLYVYVGGLPAALKTGITAGGWNGGGASSQRTDYATIGGGGATDIRLVSGAWNNSTSLLSRFIVAGGGGSGAYNGSKYGVGGAGGGLQGKTGINNVSDGLGGTGGTQTAGGKVPHACGGVENGGFGYGGHGSTSTKDCMGGAGGGGWYGGGGGETQASGGGGGSGFVLTEESITNVPEGYSVTSDYYLSNAETISGDNLVPTHDGAGTVYGNTGAGFAKITLVSKANVANIEVTNASLEPIFNEDNYEYNLYLEEGNDVTFKILNPDGHQQYLGEGTYFLNAGDVHHVTVIEQDGSLAVYRFQVYAAKAQAVDISFESITYEFNSKTYLYDLEVDADITHVTPQVVVNNGATYEISGGQKLYFGNNQVFVTVKESGKSDSIYIFNISRNNYFDDFQDFRYTGGAQTYVVPKSGYYKLETWGASGGSYSTTYTGGKGGYSTGIVYLNEGQILYVYVGGQGTGATGITKGGYNGGGDSSGRTNYKTYSGGGATDIRLVDGAWNDSASLLSRFIVAGGGGSGAWNGTYGGTGGAGGGLTGIAGTSTYANSVIGKGGTQTSGGTHTVCSGNQNGSFGIGGNGSTISSDCMSGAGGGGWYGGASGSTSGGGAGGGSGFVLTKETSSNVPVNYSVSSSYYLEYAETKAGNLVIPDYTGTGTMTGNSGNGYAKISFVGSSIDATLESLTVNHGVLSPAFDSEVLEYTLNLNSDDISLTIDAEASSVDSIISGVGTFDVPSGTHEFQVSVTSSVGVVQIYKINVTRPLSSNPYLKNIKLNGSSLSGYSPNQLDYEVTLPYNAYRIDLEPVLGTLGQRVTYDSSVAFNGDEVTTSILSIAEDGSQNAYYTIKLKREQTTLLKSITLDNGAFRIPFNPNVTEYDLEVPINIFTLPISAIPYNESAKVTIEGNGYIETEDSQITITVTNGDLEPRVYTINLIRVSNIESNFEFPYTGDYQTFVAPAYGRYKLEVWGAEGGSYNSTYTGGKGGYSKGTVLLNQGQVLYVYVGGKGKTAKGVTLGGYNGGAISSHRSDYATASAGGATDIRTFISENGEWNDANSLLSRFIVAGGGGSGAWNGSTGGKGGAGGGLTGISGTSATSDKAGTGGTQTNGGTKQTCGNNQIGSFGSGGASDQNTNYCMSGSGGGGWYGGAAGSTNGTGSGGGSGFVLNKTTASNTPTGYLVDFKFYLEDSETIAGNQTIPNHSGNSYMVGNSGDGYAKITLLSLVSSNNFLKTLTINDGDIALDFDTTTQEYSLNLGADDAVIKIDATPKDENAVVSGTGLIDVKPNASTHEITVMATDGSIRVYTLKLNRIPSSDATPLNIKLDKAISSLCNQSTDYCNYTFNENTLEYEITFAYNQGEVELVPELKSKFQGVEYRLVEGDTKTVVSNGIADLETKSKIVMEIEITSEDNIVTELGNSNSTTYRFTLMKDQKGNNNLASLAIKNPDIPIPDFDAYTYEYYVEIAGEYASFDVEAIPEAENAKVKVMGNTNLKVGLNDCVVQVTSESGIVKSYIIHAYKKTDTNTYLGNLVVRDNQTSDVMTLSPEFNKIFNEYSITVPNSVSEINIEASAESGSAIVIGAGVKTLSSGVNTFSITVTSGDSTNVYHLTVIRDKNSNPNIQNIVINGYSLNPTFQCDTLEYTVNYSGDITQFDMQVTPEEYTTTVSIKGNNLTKTTNEIVITSIAENGSYKVYKIYAYKNLSDNNHLKDIQIDHVSLANFDANTTSYEIDVLEDVSQVNIEGILEDNAAKISGNGVYSLAKGANSITLTVTSELGNAKNYELTINRALNSDVTLKEVKNNQNSDVVKIEDTTLGYDYLINVQYEVNSIALEGIAKSSTSKVIGNKTYSLATGNNDFKLQVIAEDNTSKDYIVRVVRDKSANDDLAFLYLHEGGLMPNFKETTISYDVKIPYEKTNVVLEAITEDKNATYEIIGDTTNLEVGVERSIIVRVYSEKYKLTKEKYKDYTINVVRQKDTSDNLALKDLTAKIGEEVKELTPTFDPNTLNYTLEVENNVSSIHIEATAIASDVTVLGTGDYSLKVGKNLISVFVIGQSGIQKDYQIVVTRKKSSNATLSSLVVKGHVLSPGFRSDNENYQLNTSLSELEFTTIKPTEVEATYEVIGNSNFKTGDNIVNIKVTAPDGVTTKTYRLTVTKEGSKNNNLSSLSVEGYDLEPAFHKGVTFYAVNVPNHINSIVINATSEDVNANITGTGLKMIDTGENYFDVVVRSEAGTDKTYTVLVTRDPSDNNYLANLVVSDGTLDSLFDKDKTNYEVTVPYEVSEITLSGYLEDANALASNLGTHSLAVGENNFSIVVTSEAGNIRTYYVKVIREEIVSAYLSSLEVQDYELDPEFNKEVLEYYVNVNNEVTSLTLNYQTEDEQATVEVTGNENFSVGMNEVHIKVIASDNVVQKEYVLYVNRAMSTNNYLDYITVTNGTFTEDFESTKVDYTVNVPNHISEVTIDASVQDKNSKIISGTGNKTLTIGENLVYIKVRSSIGVTRTYTLHIIRKASDNNYLNSLKVLDGTTEFMFTPEFKKDVNRYTVEVSNNLEFVNIVAVLEDSSATLSGTGIYPVVSGENNFDVIVTSQSGVVNIYHIVINKAKSSNNNLSRLIPSVGTLEPEFDPNELNYTLDVGDFSSLSFIAEAENDSASISGHEIKGVPEGESTRTISVTAENGDIKNYVVNIIRESASEAKLSNLVIAGYEFEFDPDTFSYNLNVSESKRKLLASEITATPKDSEATVNLMGDLELENGMINIYTIEVIAKDGYTTQEYTLNITRDSKEYTLTSSVYEIIRSDDFDYVIGILPNTKISEFQLNFQNEQSMLHVYREDGNLISSSDTLVGTGMIIKLESTNYVYDELRIIVRGDLTKDGKVNGADQVKLINYVGKASSLDSYQSLAADLTKDGKINGADQVKLINYVGKSITEIN